MRSKIMIARPQDNTADTNGRSHFRKGQPYQLISFDLDRTLIFHAKGAKHDEAVALLAELGFPTTVAAYQSATHVARQFFHPPGGNHAPGRIAAARTAIGGDQQQPLCPATPPTLWFERLLCTRTDADNGRSQSRLVPSVVGAHRRCPCCCAAYWR